MNRLKLHPALCALALVFCGIGTVRGQYTITGTTPGGGNIVVGSGVNLGSIASGDGILSSVGFDNLTFLPGSDAYSMSADTVYFTTPGDIVLNSGTVSAGLGFNAFTFISTNSNVSGTLTNNNLITPVSYSALTNVNIGGNFSTTNLTGGNVGTGIDFASGETISGVSVVNNGSITGGGISLELSNSSYGGNLFTDKSTGGNAADAIDFTSYSDGSSILVVNRGLLAGGAFGSITNSSVGENNNDSSDAGGDVSNGVSVDVADAIAVSIANTGTIIGGSFGTITDSRVGSNNGQFDEGGNAANGIVVSAFANVSGLSVANQGAITGGGIANNAGAFGGNYSNNNIGGNATSGIALAGQGLNGFSLVNQGTISGGAISANSGNAGGNYNGSNTGGNVSMGVSLSLANTANAVTIYNYGTITGGAINNNSSSIGSSHANGVGGSVSDGVSIASGGVITNVAIFNSGMIAGGSITNDTGSIGGQHGLAGGDVGSGISLLSASGGSNLSITNYGVIAGGNNLSDSAGAGILATTGNLTINNWGAISTGAGANPAAINLMYSGNNTVNLDGHSSVNGPITAATSSNNNVLNLNFTGLSPAVQTALKASILAQGPLTNWSGTFTVRGVTYTVDPMNINFNLSSYQLQALTPNQAAIGASLDSAAVNPPPGSPLFTLFNAIDNSGNVPGALEQLSPEQYAVLGALAIAHSDFLTQSIDARLNNIRNGSESIDASGAGGTTVAGLTKDDGKTDLTKGGGVAPSPESTPDRWGFFATGDGLFFRGNPHDVDAQDGKANTAGTLVGVDGKAGDHAIIGAMFAYDNTSAELNGNGGHANIESYTGGIYANWHDSGFYLNGLGAYTRNTYRLDRNIAIGGLFGDASSDPNGNQATANLDGGYDWDATDRLAVGPLAGVQYVHLDIDSFNEANVGQAGLSVNSQDMNSLQSRVGVHANYHLATTATSAFALDFHAAWQHEYLDDSRAIGASFEGAGLAPFAVQTASPLRDAAVVGLGVNFTFHDRLTLFADYELELWTASYFEQTINGGARISF